MYTARQLTIAADETQAFYDRTKALPLMFNTLERAESDDNMEDKDDTAAPPPEQPPPTAATNADSFYAIAYAKRLAEHMAKEAAAPRAAPAGVATPPKGPALGAGLCRSAAGAR